MNLKIISPRQVIFKGANQCYSSLVFPFGGEQSTPALWPQNSAPFQAGTKDSLGSGWIRFVIPEIYIHASLRAAFRKTHEAISLHGRYTQALHSPIGIP